jgi:hypothetical protein
MDQPRTSGVPRNLLVLFACAVAAFAAFAASAQAMRVEGARATNEVQRWHSKRAFNEPYAYVDVVHNGKRLGRTAVSRCKGQYADKEVTVQISTCGNRWRVRAAYVSLSSPKEHFRIVYAPRDFPGRANYRVR